MSTPAVTPADAVIAAAGCLNAVIKGTYSGHLADKPLAELTRLSNLFVQASAPPKLPPPLVDALLLVRRSLQLTTIVTKEGRIITANALCLAPLTNPHIPLPGHALSPPCLITTVSSNGQTTTISHLLAHDAQSPRVE